jgi:alpha-1,2-mannosyltransferase
LLLLALVLADAARPDSARTKGALIGLAAGLKLTPGLFVVYLLLTRRFRAAAVAFGVFVGTMAIGWLALPGASADFWLHSQNLGTRINRHVTIADATDQALRPMFMRLFGDGSAAVVAWFAVGAVVAIVGLAAAARASARGAELVGVLLTAGVGLAVSPISWTHHWVWVLPVVAVLADRVLRSTRRPVWSLALAGYLALTLAWPVTVTADGHLSAHAGRLPYGLVWLVPHMDGQEFHWNWWQTAVGDSLLIGNLVLLGGAAWYLLAPGRSRRGAEGA